MNSKHFISNAYLSRYLIRVLYIQTAKLLSCPISMSSSNGTADGNYYRKDGVRITHDPYAPGMAEKYGLPGDTDNEGFDPYRDSVGPGIYGGIVKRDKDGNVIIGKQYQNHNPRPGPVYAGGGYTPSSKALKDIEGVLVPLLNKYPELSNDITTGGASPLHMCGMSQQNQLAVTTLVEHGADIEALDTYGMTPLHRMASNNLAIGAKMLIKAGANPGYRGKIGISPMDMAMQSRALNVIEALEETPDFVFPFVNIDRVLVNNAGFHPVNGMYHRHSHDTIPKSFKMVCENEGWQTQKVWQKLNGQKDWYKHEINDSYIYFNDADKQWWIDGPDGLGVYKSPGPLNAPPAHTFNLIHNNIRDKSLPLVSTFRKLDNKACDEL